MSDFVRAHSWALETAAKTLALGAFGLDYLDHASIGLSCFRLESNATLDGPRRNPSRAFKFVEIQLVDIETWCEPGEGRAEVAERFAKIRQLASEEFTRDKPDNPLVGVLQVGFQVHGEHRMLWHCFPQYRRSDILLPPPISDPPVPAAFRDLITLCTASINAGYPFRWLSGRGPFAYPGRYTHTKHQWTWEPLFTSWEDYQKGRANCPPLAALSDLRSGLTPDQLMLLIALY